MYNRLWMRDRVRGMPSPRDVNVIILEGWGHHGQFGQFLICKKLFMIKGNKVNLLILI